MYYTLYSGLTRGAAINIDGGSVPATMWASNEEYVGPDEHDCEDTSLGCCYNDDDDYDGEWECQLSGGWFSDPYHPYLHRAVRRSLEEDYEWEATPEYSRTRVDQFWCALRDIAARFNLPSAIAAWDAYLLNVSGGGLHTYTSTAHQIATFFCLPLDLLRAPAGSYDEPYLGISTDFDEQAILYRSPARSTIGARRRHDAPERARGCGCLNYHCEQCFPSGPPDTCRCDTCRLRYEDDLSEPDDWAGLPEMPATPDQRCRFGIEIEFNAGNRSEIIRAMTRAGMACLDIGYTHEVSKFWKMTTDSTVTGGELVSPVMPGDDASIDMVREAIRLVKASGGETGNKVGMHVHLDVTPFNAFQLKALAHNLRQTEKFLSAFVPQHRYDGQSNACGATWLTEYEWGEIMEWVGGVSPDHRRRSRENRDSSAPVTRFRSFNFNALLSYGTIECRLLGHTLNTAKVRTWIRVLQSIMEASRRGTKIRGEVDVLAWLDRYGLEPEHAARFRAVAEQRDKTEYLVTAA